MADFDDETRSHTVLTAGTVVAQYRIVQHLGAGGMGEVYLAEDTRLNRRVALKFLPAHFANNSNMRTRFEREAQAAAGLDHPNIVTIHEVGELEERPYIAMQFVEGRTLMDWVGSAEIAGLDLIDVARQVAEGLETAHQNGITHRDIKPANIMVDSSLRATILDFGLACVQGDQTITAHGTALGTAAYMSPEQARGEDVGPRSDIFSFGSVLYELVSGRPPFLRDNTAATLHAISTADPPPLPPPEEANVAKLGRIIFRCLAKNPSERYQSAGDLAADLRFASGGTPLPSSIESAQPKSPPSIAVLPFTNLSNDPENEYFADGLTDELLAILAKTTGLKVTGRTSSFAFKGKQEDVRDIGKKLGVEHILEGSVRKSGNRVRISVQLVSASDGFHAWSETFDRVLEDVFAIQDEIAAAVSEAMNVTLALVTKRVESPEVFELNLRAHQFANQLSEPGLKGAIGIYDRVISIDPLCARAWAGKAWAMFNASAYGLTDVGGSYVEIREVAQKSLDLDPDLPLANTVMALVLGTFDFDFQASIDLLRKAHTLAPGDSEVASTLGVFNYFVGYDEEAFRLVDLAVSLDPLNPEAHHFRARLLTNSGRTDEAMACYDVVRGLSPNRTALQAYVSLTHTRAGRYAEAIEAALREEAPGYRETALCAASFMAGDLDEGDRALERLLSLGAAWSYQVAVCYAVRGDHDKAMEYLEISKENKDPGIPWSGKMFFLEELRKDPRMQTFLRGLGLIS